MNRLPRRNHTPTFKAKVVLAAIKGDRTLVQRRNSSTFTPIRSHRGKRSSRARAADVFGPGGGNGTAQPAVDVKSLHAKIGALTFGRSAQHSRPAERKAMIDRTHDLPITRQARALNISRGSVY